MTTFECDVENFVWDSNNLINSIQRIHIYIPWGLLSCISIREANLFNMMKHRNTHTSSTYEYEQHNNPKLDTKFIDLNFIPLAAQRTTS